MINNTAAATPWGYYYNSLNMTVTAPQSCYVNPWGPWWYVPPGPLSYPFYTQITAPTSEQSEGAEENTDLSETIREIVREEIAAFKKEPASEVVKEIVAQTRRSAGTRRIAPHS